ncbi:MAG: hypothetical protein IT373_36700 [Polyangiaceae bacterium]|nr:hypothetical protein [Polyangiaceae bacterium]
MTAEMSEERALAVPASRRVFGIGVTVGMLVLSCAPPAAWSFFRKSPTAQPSLVYGTLVFMLALSAACFWVALVTLYWLRQPVFLLAGARTLRVQLPLWYLFHVKTVRFSVPWSNIVEVRAERSVVSTEDGDRVALALHLETTSASYSLPWAFRDAVGVVVAEIHRRIAVHAATAAGSTLGR